MAVTMKDIARHCGLSGGAVSQVLRNPKNPRFSEETRKLILDTAARLDYRQNRLSLALRTNRTNLIGLMLPWNEPETMDCVERVAAESGYKLLIQFSAHPRPGVELEALKSFLDWNVDGILWEPSGTIDAGLLPLLEQIQRSGPPLVQLERSVGGVKFPLVASDYAPAIRASVTHLAEQGYERILFVSDVGDVGDLKLIDDKLTLFREAAEAAALPFEVHRINPAKRKEDLSLLFSQPEIRNGAVACYSWLVSDCVDAAEAVGLRIPEELGLVMMIDLLVGGRLRISNLLRPTITAIRVKSGVLAELAVRRLLAGIRKEDVPDTPIPSHCELVIQTSTRRK